MTDRTKIALATGTGIWVTLGHLSTVSPLFVWPQIVGIWVFGMFELVIFHTMGSLNLENTGGSILASLMIISLNAAVYVALIFQVLRLSRQSGSK